MKEIKPCPFCGGKASLHQGLLKGTNTMICHTCGADVMFYGADRDIDKFIKKWNSRAERKADRT